jgi:hypothetical protein
VDPDVPPVATSKDQDVVMPWDWEGIAPHSKALPPTEEEEYIFVDDVDGDELPLDDEEYSSFADDYEYGNGDGDDAMGEEDSSAGGRRLLQKAKCMIRYNRNFFGGTYKYMSHWGDSEFL